MKKLLVFLTTLVVAAGLSSISVPAAHAVTPDICAEQGTPNRVFVDAQSWWKRVPGTTATDFGHVHVGACIPERDVLSSNINIPIRIIMHDNPGKLADLSLVFKTPSTEVTVAKLVPSGRTCVGTCTFTANAYIDISKFPVSGLEEIRFRGFVDEPDGNRMIVSHNFQVNIQNGKSVSNVTRQPYLRGKGWYTGFNYCESSLRTDLVPLADSYSGTAKFRVRGVDHGSTDVDPTHHLVAIDSDAHVGDPGIVLLDGPGPLPEQDLFVDTTALTDGVHKLVQRTDCQKGDNINSGVLVTYFKVYNGVVTN